MKVRITRPTFLRGKPVRPGEEFDIEQSDAINLIGSGKAIPVKGEKAETTELPRAAIETAAIPAPEPPAPQAEEAEAPKPKRGRTRKSE